MTIHRNPSTLLNFVGVLIAEQQKHQSYLWLRLGDAGVTPIDAQHEWNQLPTVREVME